MRKPTITALAVLTLLAACSTEKEKASTTTAASGTTAASSGSTTPDATSAPTDSTLAPPVVDDRAPGVTDDTIKIGITYVDLSQVKDIIGFDHGDYEAAYNAVIDEINANGGIHGRTLEPVFAPIDPQGSDASAAACTRLTQDEQVFVTMGFFLDADSALCYVDTNETLLIGGTQTDETRAQAAVGWWSWDASEEESAAGFGALIDAGLVSANVGVVGIATDEAFFEASVKPLLAAAGVEPVGVAYLDPAITDANLAVADAQTIAERFKADGVDQVLLLGNSGSTFAQGVARTDFRPQLVFQSLDAASTFSTGEGNDLSVMEGAMAPGRYNGANLYAELGSPTSECVARAEAAGLRLMPSDDVPRGESQQIVSVLTACRAMALLVAGLEGAGEELNYGTFTTAMYNLGEFPMPFADELWFYGPPPSTDGDPTPLIYAWDPASATFQVDNT